MTTLTTVSQGQMCTRQLHLIKEGLRSPNDYSLVKRSGAADKVWYHGYLTERTQITGKGGGHYNSAYLVNRSRSQGT
jgi:hypothetical protein